MTNVFKDQEKFMLAGDQTVGVYNKEQYELYLKLIEEEYVRELLPAVEAGDEKEQLDALIDTIVVIVGALHSFGVDVEAAWAEVHRSNMSKVDVNTGKLIKREDGKVLKPATFSPANVEPFLKR